MSLQSLDIDSDECAVAVFVPMLPCAHPCSSINLSKLEKM